MIDDGELDKELKEDFNYLISLLKNDAFFENTEIEISNLREFENMAMTNVSWDLIKTAQMFVKHVLNGRTIAEKQTRYYFDKLVSSISSISDEKDRMKEEVDGLSNELKQTQKKLQAKEEELRNIKNQEKDNKIKYLERILKEKMGDVQAKGNSDAFGE